MIIFLLQFEFYLIVNNRLYHKQPLFVHFDINILLGHSLHILLTKNLFDLSLKMFRVGNSAGGLNSLNMNQSEEEEKYILNL